MGIAFRDLKYGSYYKGYHKPSPNGQKCFFIILANCFNGQKHSVIGWYILRGVNGASWQTVALQGNPDDESLCKQEVRPSAITSEGLPLPNTTTAPSATHPVQTPTPAANPLRKLFVSEEEERARAKEQSKAERNKGKSVVPGNAYSEVCLRCGQPTKQVPMMNLHWCPGCEPE